MKAVLRKYLGLFLALAVALTAHSAAAAQGSRDASGQMVICTGTGPTVIYVDDNGQPTKPPHYCPDCVMQLLVAVADVMTLRAPDAVSMAERPTAPALPQHGGSPLRATARAPPLAG